MDWNYTIDQIRHCKLELAGLAPELGPVIAPHDGAPRRVISATERRIGRRLPPSYRAFLHQHDGWPQFFEGANLLGTSELVQPKYAELTRAVFDAYETPIPEVGPSSRPEGRSDAMIPFGIDPKGTTLFAFNPAVVSPDGEMEVIAWMNGLGSTYDGFAGFLSMVLEVLQMDLDDRRLLQQRSA